MCVWINILLYLCGANNSIIKSDIKEVYEKIETFFSDGCSAHGVVYLI